MLSKVSEIFGEFLGLENRSVGLPSGRTKVKINLGQGEKRAKRSLAKATTTITITVTSAVAITITTTKTMKTSTTKGKFEGGKIIIVCSCCSLEFLEAHGRKGSSQQTESVEARQKFNILAAEFCRQTLNVKGICASVRRNMQISWRLL